MKGTGKLYALLDKEPPDALTALADGWATQGYIGKLHESGVIMELGTPELAQSARWLVETTEVQLEIDRSVGREVLRVPNGQESSRSHGAGTQWVFALTWIFARMSA
jgi:hypothetical protein